MLRATLAAILLGSAALAADPLPKDISPDDRAEFIKAWRIAFLKHRDLWQQKHDDAVTLAKFAASKKEGEKQLTEAKTALKNLELKPWAVADSPARFIQNKEAAAGQVVIIQPALHKFAIAEEREDGTLVETVTGAPEKPVIHRYLIATLGTVPKGKKAADVELPGLWYWAGNADIKGRSTPILYRFEIKPADFPK